MTRSTSTRPTPAAAADVIGAGHSDRYLSDEEAVQTIVGSIDHLGLRDKKVLVLIPDRTRTCPLPLFYRTLCEHLGPAAKQLDFMIALGTHQPMSEEAIDAHVGTAREERTGRWGRHRIINHAWQEPGMLTEIGTFGRDEIAEITEGLFAMDVRVIANRLIQEYDTVLTCGPVFPHEVVGFSGGNKYLMPGVAGQEIIDFFHWLGAVVTNPKIIGNKWTRTRAVVDRAAAFVQAERAALCMVVHDQRLAGLYAGTNEDAWSAAADLSDQLHIRYVEKPFKRILARAPEMYDDIWTAGKCMYKMEPVVADGGELIIYAPHITEISRVHGKVIEEIGYHCRDYFLQQWDRFAHFPGGILAHSTHVKGDGTFDASTGVETPRIDVKLATGIPRERCEKINLEYLDPATVDPEAWEERDEPGVLVVSPAGEHLYRVGAPPRRSTETKP